jgi:hypothetical protein
VNREEQSHKRIVGEMIHAIDVAGDFEDQFGEAGIRKTWVAVKMVSLLFFMSDTLGTMFGIRQRSFRLRNR